MLIGKNGKTEVVKAPLVKATIKTGVMQSRTSGNYAILPATVFPSRAGEKMPFKINIKFQLTSGVEGLLFGYYHGSGGYGEQNGALITVSDGTVGATHGAMLSFYGYNTTERFFYKGTKIIPFNTVFTAKMTFDGTILNFGLYDTSNNLFDSFVINNALVANIFMQPASTVYLFRLEAFGAATLYGDIYSIEIFESDTALTADKLTHAYYGTVGNNDRVIKDTIGQEHGLVRGVTIVDNGGTKEVNTHGEIQYIGYQGRNIPAYGWSYTAKGGNRAAYNCGLCDPDSGPTGKWYARNFLGEPAYDIILYNISFKPDHIIFNTDTSIMYLNDPSWNTVFQEGKFVVTMEWDNIQSKTRENRVFGFRDNTNNDLFLEAYCQTSRPQVLTFLSYTKSGMKYEQAVEMLDGHRYFTAMVSHAVTADHKVMDIYQADITRGDKKLTYMGYVDYNMPTRDLTISFGNMVYRGNDSPINGNIYKIRMFYTEYDDTLKGEDKVMWLNSLYNNGETL